MGASSGPSIDGCAIFPPDNPWNRDVSGDPVDAQSDVYIERISASGASFLHANFGTSSGIPYAVVPESQPAVPVVFTVWPDESDAGPYPIPPDVPVESGDDRHVLVVQTGVCKLYEFFDARRAGDEWQASVGVVFDLGSNELRPDTWTSADAAGLPILPGLTRYEEVAAGEIRHALRFTVERARRAFIHPATHFGSSEDPRDRRWGSAYA